MNYILRSELGATSAGTACVEYPFFRVAEKSDGAALAKSVACKEAHSTNRQIKRSHGELSIHRGFALFRGGFVPPSLLFTLLQALYEAPRCFGPILFCHETVRNLQAPFSIHHPYCRP